MPQMAPIMWLSLFIVFSLAFFLFCSLNYFSVSPSPSSCSKGVIKPMISMSWKW